MIESSTHEDAVNENPDDGLVRYFCGRKWQKGPVYTSADSSRPEGVMYDFNGRYKKLIGDKNDPRNP